MKFVSWNINGVKNILSKSKDGIKHNNNHPDNVLAELIGDTSPDFICLQEVRCNEALSLLGSLAYSHIFSNCAKEKKGYSGTCIITKHEPRNVIYDFGTFNEDPQHNLEGRVITLEYDRFYVVTVYTPNSKTQLERLDYRTKLWDPLFSSFVQHLQKTNKHIIICGDLNVAHQEIDIYRPGPNKKHAGFTDQERSSFSRLLSTCNLIDTFRTLHKSVVKYSWWSNFHQSRAKNNGWRIDYFLTSSQLALKISKADILTEYKGSDHCPVYLEVDVKA